MKELRQIEDRLRELPQRISAMRDRLLSHADGSEQTLQNLVGEQDDLRAARTMWLALAELEERCSPKMAKARL